MKSQGKDDWIIDLSGADPHGANLRGADLRDANLLKVNLRGVFLKETTVTTKQLDQAKLLQGAMMPDGTEHA
jgi:uncharacterized protein YjbI with pentapeptide repeats